MEEINSSFPVQYNLFTNEPEEILMDLDIIFSKPTKWRLSNSVFIVTSEDFSELIISGHNVKPEFDRIWGFLVLFPYGEGGF